MADVYIADFGLAGRRGADAAVMIRLDDGSILTGTLFFRELPAGEYATDAVRALEYVQANVDMIIEGLTDPEQDPDDGIYAGWARNPHTEMLMRQRAKAAAGWE